jgi:alpha-N-arabinofuranosidase
MRWYGKTAAGLAAAALAFGAPARAEAQPAEAAAMVVHADRPGPRVNRQIFGQFAEHLGRGIYEGIWVGEGSKIPNIRGYRKDVVEALRALKVPLVRWPGGCFADEYLWRDGIGPRSKRPVKVNTHWGGVTESNAFGTHEFMDFAELIGAEAYVSANIGSAPPRDMEQWVEYMTYPSSSSLARERAANGRKEPWKLPYLGLGNELWGCGGNMRAEYAADVTRRYSTFVKAPAGQKILRIASGASGSNYNWTEVLMREAGSTIDGIGVHYYTLPGDWDRKGPATGCDEAAWAATLGKTLRMDEYVARHSAIMDKYDPQKRVWLAVDEWGTWYDVEPGTNPGFLYQQNSLRDALVAAININIFVKHADRVKMANIAQMANVLQAMILTDGPRMVLTPTYHAFSLYKPFQDATALPIELNSPWYHKDQWAIPAVNAAAVRDTAGQVHVALVNLDPNRPVPVSARLSGLGATSVSGQVLTAPAMDAVNSFDQPDRVAPAPFAGAAISGDTLTVTLPPKSVVMLSLR